MWHFFAFSVQRNVYTWAWFQSFPQALMDEILMLQDEISELQSSLADELVSGSPESDPAEQLALQSTLTVLAERMSTIKMKASGKQQLLEVTSSSEVTPVVRTDSDSHADTYLGSFRDLHFYCSPFVRSWCRVSGRLSWTQPCQCGAMNASFFSPFCLISAWQIENVGSKYLVGTSPVRNNGGRFAQWSAVWKRVLWIVLLVLWRVNKYLVAGGQREHTGPWKFILALPVLMLLTFNII